MFCNIQETEN